MSYTVRRPTAEEEAGFFASMAAGFGEPGNPDGPQDAEVFEADRHWAAVFTSEGADPQIVGTTTAYSFQLTVPGGAQIPAGGLAGVTVQPTHRRRGLLRQMMEAHIDECVERGEPASLLTASETGIYDRFGYGWAVEHEALRLSTYRGKFRADLADQPWSKLQLRMLPSTDDMGAALPAIYNRVQAQRAGMLSRRPEWWQGVLAAEEGWKGGGDLFCAVARTESGTDVGYVLYVLDELKTDNHFRSDLRIKELIAADGDVEASLWRHCLDRDLIANVAYKTASVDSPMRRMLAEPRWLRIDWRDDELWLRPLDIVRLLEARTYQASGSLVIEVVDDFRPELGGRFRVDTTNAASGDGASANGGTDGIESTASATRTDDDPDLTMPTEVLGSIYLGAINPVTLGVAGRIQEHTPGALNMARALFMTPTPPFNPTRF